MDILIFLLLFVDIYGKLGFVVSRKIVYDASYYHISDTKVSYIDGKHFSCVLILEGSDNNWSSAHGKREERRKQQ